MTQTSDPAAAQNGRIPPPTDAAAGFEEFINLVSHDLRNSVRALSELPLWIEEDLKEAGHSIEGAIAENLAFMNTHTQRLDRMLCDLLVYSRIGRMQDTACLELQTAVDDVVAGLRISDRFTIATNLGSHHISIGARDILTLFSALLSNAIKHHDRTEGRIEIHTHQIEGDVQITIADDGPGIPELSHDRIFEVMTTLRARDEVEGSGMGLAIVRKIVDQHGGRVWIEKRENLRGTCVNLQFPIASLDNP